MGFLYYRPLTNYLETRTQLASRRTEVAELRVERARLERRLARTTSLVVLAREARRIGYIKPGERLFIVKGRSPRLGVATPADAATVSGDGRPSATVAAQLGPEPARVSRVVVRCPFGLPAVTEQEPYDDAGAPFPTTYYLTCRFLVAAVSRLEAAGGVERWSAAVTHDPGLARALERGTARQREIRHAARRRRVGVDDGASLDSGIGGSRNPRRLKCLHAHVAFALAEPGYELGEAILSEV